MKMDSSLTSHLLIFTGEHDDVKKNHLLNADDVREDNRP